MQCRANSSQRTYGQPGDEPAHARDIAAPIAAVLGGMLAWALDRPPFLAVFTAQAAFMAIYLLSIAGRA
jgi:hypothetical protein